MHQAITEWFGDTAWDELSDVMNSGATNRLKRVDRALQASVHIQEMLFADKLGTDDKEDSGAEFQSMSPTDREMLSMAALDLARFGLDMLEEVRGGAFLPSSDRLGRRHLLRQGLDVGES